MIEPNIKARALLAYRSGGAAYVALQKMQRQLQPLDLSQILEEFQDNTGKQDWYRYLPESIITALIEFRWRPSRVIATLKETRDWSKVIFHRDSSTMVP